jgi:lipocalin
MSKDKKGNNKYDWAIVSDPLKAFLFVLARDVDQFKKKYDKEIKKKLKAYGFTGLSAPIETHQGKGCVYEATTRTDLIEVDAPTDLKDL